VAARALVWAADHPRREVFVGGTTVATIVANRLAPGLLDRYLGRTGFDSQQSAEGNRRDGPDNLFRPVHGDFGAHGRFDHQSHSRSFQFEATAHSRALLTGAVLAAGIGLSVLRRHG
jgi:hypothetical protein